jgi:hypothetical protein
MSTPKVGAYATYFAVGIFSTKSQYPKAPPTRGRKMSKVNSHLFHRNVARSDLQVVKHF